MPKAITYDMISLPELNEEAYFSLYRKVYEDTSSLTRRWQWEYRENPLADDIKFMVAHSGGRLVAATTRLPFDIAIGGQVHRAYFSVDSMVDPDFRRMGIMERLYEDAGQTMPLFYSKGTMPGMYKLLMKMGYQPVLPNTFLVCYFKPLQLIMKRLGLSGNRTADTQVLSDEHVPNGFIAIRQFGEEFDSFFQSTTDVFYSRVVKGSRYMNWRYVRIPHKTYQFFYRKDKQGKIAAAVVLSIAGSIGKIVDIHWDPANPAEPERTISLSKTCLRRLGCTKVLCWCTYQPLRVKLKKQLFFDRGETPRFSVYSTSMNLSQLVNGSRFHFVDGDGDHDIL